MTARILIIEDEEPLTLLLRYNLEAEGYEVDTSARGDEAEIKLKEMPPDLLVLDWMERRYDGVNDGTVPGGLTGQATMPARILIIEDEEPLTLLLRYNLEAEGYEIVAE